MSISARRLAAAWVAALLAMSAAPAVAEHFPSPDFYDASLSVAVGEYAAFPVISGGIPLYWNGRVFEDSEGRRYSPPAAVGERLPDMSLVGVLVGGEGDGEEIVRRILRRSEAEAANLWQRLNFVVIDLPDVGGDFEERWRRMQDLPAESFLKTPPRKDFADNESLQKALDEMHATGGDGFILRPVESGYGDGGVLLALPYEVDDAVVLRHNSGKGEFAGMMGSMDVESVGGGTFKIATGFSNRERQQPPPVGARITYKYRSFTETGKPRNPVYLRLSKVKPESPRIAGALRYDGSDGVFYHDYGGVGGGGRGQSSPWRATVEFQVGHCQHRSAGHFCRHLVGVVSFRFFRHCRQRADLVGRPEIVLCHFHYRYRPVHGPFHRSDSRRG